MRFGIFQLQVGVHKICSVCFVVLLVLFFAKLRYWFLYKAEECLLVRPSTDGVFYDDLSESIRNLSDRSGLEIRSITALCLPCQ